MKQVTGATNNKPEIKNVSIRLRLDGHSFLKRSSTYRPKRKNGRNRGIDGQNHAGSREVFDAKAAPALMRINGMEPTEKECILTSDPQQPVIALMAADKASVESPCPAEGEDTLDLPVATYRGIHGILPLDIPL